MIDSYIYVIIALLPLTACMLVFQANPYHALVIRGILGAVAALVYAVLGAADVALTEALVGTMLAITLYAIAVRSSLVVRVGILTEDAIADNPPSTFQVLINHLRTIVSKYHLRLELVTYPDPKALEQGLQEKAIHAICTKAESVERDRHLYQTAIRVYRLYDILQSELNLPETILTYVNLANEEVRH